MRVENGERGGGREAEYLRERCRELESLLQQYQAQAEEWRELARVVWSLFEDYDGVIFVLEPDGAGGSAAVINANRAMCRLLGRPQEALKEMPLVELLSPADRRRFKAMLAKTLGHGSRQVEVDLLQAAGGKVPVELTLIPYDIRDRRRVLCLGRDITARQAAEEALRRSEERYRTLIENINDVVFSIDAEGRFDYISPAMERATGYKPEEIIGKSLPSFMTPEDYEDLLGRLTFDEKGWHAPMEFRVLDGKGGFRFVRTSGRQLLEDGKLVGITGNMTDITDRKLAEEALRESEERYRVVFETTGTAMCVMEKGGRIAYANQEFERLTGYRTEEGKAARSLQSLLLREDRRLLEITLERLYSGETGPLHLECRLRAPGGRRRLARANLVAIPGSDSIVVSMLDITREKEYERALEENAQRLRDFLSVASHELRHPIAILKGYAQVLQEMGEGMPPERMRAALNSMQHSLDRLGLLGEELLDVSRIEEDRFSARRRSIDPFRLVSEVLAEMRQHGWRQEIRADLDRGVARMKADRGMLKRLLIILLENACKYSPVDSAVELTMERMGGEVLISVLDRGAGVPEGQEEKVFDRFYQVDDVTHHSKPGIGLGLYIARQIAAAHGGRIWYEHRRGGGSAFRVAIPQE